MILNHSPTLTTHLLRMSSSLLWFATISLPGPIEFPNPPITYFKAINFKSGGTNSLEQFSIAFVSINFYPKNYSIEYESPPNTYSLATNEACILTISHIDVITSEHHAELVSALRDINLATDEYDKTKTESFFNICIEKNLEVARWCPTLTFPVSTVQGEPRAGNVTFTFEEQEEKEDGFNLEVKIKFSKDKTIRPELVVDLRRKGYQRVIGETRLEATGEDENKFIEFLGNLENYESKRYLHESFSENRDPNCDKYLGSSKKNGP